MHIEGYDGGNNLQSSPDAAVQRRQSAEELRKQFSSASVGSVEDPTLSESINNLQK